MAKDSSNPSLLILGAAIAVGGATGIPIEIGAMKIAETTEPGVRLTMFVLGCIFFCFGFLKDGLTGNPDKSKSRRSILVFCIITFLLFGIPCSIGLADRPILAIVCACTILIFALLVRPSWIVSYSSQTKQRLQSLLILTAIAGLYFTPWSKITAALLATSTATSTETIFWTTQTDRAISAVLHVFGFASTLIINLWRYRKEISHVPPISEKNKSALSADEYFLALDRYTQALASELDRYDREVNWSDRDLAPLEAQVETEREGGARPQILHDLVEGIRANRETAVFVVVGDPGSGKSVSLRRLVRQLCGQALRSGVVPVYANLREFPSEVGLSEQSLMAFIKDCAARQTGRDGRKFLDQWYEYFRKNGRLFFILDSFDELPAVLDADENTQTHKNISASFDKLFSQELQSCRAILASRPFRAPIGVKSSRILIRPFSETQIRAAMHTWLSGRGIGDREYVMRLFKQRPQLVPMLRNPFLAELIAEYAIGNHGTKLPDGMFAVFNEFIKRRLEADEGQVKRMGTTSTQVREAAGLLALGMYRSGDLGLEVPRERAVAMLADKYPNRENTLIDAICYTRLGRIGGSGIKKFSFAHRRFAEFFVVDTVDEITILTATQSIPRDSRWRDCLVMYSGVANQAIREKIASTCWSAIDHQVPELIAKNLANGREAIHCARFLADAFRSNPEALCSFRPALTQAVMALLRSDDILVVKIGAELIPLIEQDSIPQALSLGLQFDSRWVNDTTLSSCRHLAHVPRGTLAAVGAYLSGYTSIELARKFTELEFSFSLSDSFKLHRRVLRLMMLESVVCWMLFIFFLSIVFLKSPAIALLGITSGAIFSSFLYSISSSAPNRKKPREIELNFIVTSAFLAATAYTASFVPESALSQYLAVSPHPTLAASYIGPLINVVIGVGVVRAFGGLSSLWMILHRAWLLLSKGRQWTRLKAFIKGLKRADVVNVVKGPVFLLAGFLFFRYIAELLPPRVLEILGMIGKALIGLLIAVFSLLLVAGWWRQARQGCSEFLEKRRLRRINVPTQISAAQVYASALTYREPAVRKEYLELIRSRHVPLSGPITEPPANLVESAGAREALARLHAQWLGLDT